VTEQQLARMANRRLAILRHAEEITGNVALTCRYYGISRQVFYKWRRRFDELGLDGLRDRSSRPRVCPNETRTEVVGKIIYLASATSATTAADSASRSRCPATACRST
jgi:transposase-like protein